MKKTASLSPAGQQPDLESRCSGRLTRATRESRSLRSVLDRAAQLWGSASFAQVWRCVKEIMEILEDYTEEEDRGAEWLSLSGGWPGSPAGR